MTSIAQVYTHFNGGKVSPSVEGRIDGQWYKSCLRDCKNFFITPYGGIKKRFPLLTFLNWVDVLGEGVESCSLVSFYTVEQDYFLAFVKTISGLLKVIVCVKDGVVLDDNGNPLVLDLPVSFDLRTIKNAQNNDIIYISGKDESGEPQSVVKITRVSANNWSISVVSFLCEYRVAYGDGSKTIVSGVVPTSLLSQGQVELTFTAGGVTTTVVDDGNGSFTGNNISEGTVDYDSGRFYLKASVAFDVNTVIRLKFLNYANIKASCVSFFENRLLLGGFKNSLVFMGSAVGSYESFIFGNQNNLAYIYEINSLTSSEIRFLFGKNNLLVGTDDGEYAVFGGSSGITPTNIYVSKQSNYGCGFFNPTIINDSIVFLDKKNKNIISYYYSYENNSFVGKNLNIFNNDILDGLNITGCCIADIPFTYLFLSSDNGKFPVLLYDKSNSILGWFSLEFPIKNVFSCCSIENRTLLFLANSNGIFLYKEQSIDGKFVDLPVVYNSGFGSEQTFPNNDVNQLVCLGFDINNRLLGVVWVDINNGVFILPNNVGQFADVNRFLVGVSIESFAETLPIEIYSDNQQILTIGVNKGIKDFTVKLLNSLGGKVGILDVFDMLFRYPPMPMDDPPPLYSGFKNISIFDVLTGKEITVKIQHNDVWNFELLMFAFNLVLEQ